MGGAEMRASSRYEAAAGHGPVVMAARGHQMFVKTSWAELKLRPMAGETACPTYVLGVRYSASV